ncbi:MAG: hypothetical protein AAFV88_11610 [Planctomycetota bacterium]
MFKKLLSMIVGPEVDTEAEEVHSRPEGVMCIGGPLSGTPVFNLPSRSKEMRLATGVYALEYLGFENQVMKPVYVWSSLHHEEAIDAVIAGFASDAVSSLHRESD